MWTAFIFVLGGFTFLAVFILAIAAFMRGGSAVIDPNARKS